MTPDLEAEKSVDLPHPFRVALGQVVVDGHHVDAAGGQRVQIDRQRRHQGLALAGLHLGDIALMQHHAADELHVEMALAERALGGLAHGGEGRHQDIVERGALGHLPLQILGPGPQRLVGKLLELRLERVDLLHAREVTLDAPFVGGAKNLRASAPIMRFVLSGAPLASIDRLRSRAGAAKSPVTKSPITKSYGTDQVAASRARVHRIAAAGRGKRHFSVLHSRKP